MNRQITKEGILDSFAYRTYKEIFERNGVQTIDPYSFDSFSNELSNHPPIFMIQTQGHMPRVNYMGANSSLSPAERGWVSSGTDTGGQTFYVLDEAMALAKLGHSIVIIAQRFDDGPAYLNWFQHKSGGKVEIVRVPAGGIQAGDHGKPVKSRYEFVRKEDLYPNLYGTSVDVSAIALLRGAYGFIGGYADGGVVAVAAGQALGRPSIFIAHSMGLRKLSLSGRDVRDPNSYYESKLWFGPRLHAERASFLGADFVVANTPDENRAYAELYGIDVPNSRMLPPGVNRAFFIDECDEHECYRTAAAQKVSAHDLKRDRYFMSWGRIAHDKNLAGQVRILGELKGMYPEEYKDVKLLMIGGNPENPTEEERAEIQKVCDVAGEYGLEVSAKGDIVRIGNLDSSVIALLAKDAIAYLGTQFHEPFGMAPAEMLAVGGKGFVVVPEVSGFAKWIRANGLGDSVSIIDLGTKSASQQFDIEAYKIAAEKIHLFRKHPDLKKRIERGAKFADENLRWERLARTKLGVLQDSAKEKAFRPSLYLAMPAWYRSPHTIVDVATGNFPRMPSTSDQSLAWMSEVVKDIGGQVAGWLIKNPSASRKLITVDGENSEIFADLLAASIDSPTSRVQRVASEVLGNVPQELIRRTMHSSRFHDSDFAVYGGGKVFLEENARVFVTNRPNLVGDLHIALGANALNAATANIVVSGQTWYMNTAMPCFMALASRMPVLH
ncbi:MAG TPA: glycosyltransferase [bacterium]|nr:glycosyltransferase family 1 protein [Myxococcales bacterium]HPW45634.1 glycosyltransferase [bacterium]HQG13750.1 glycosyltransferase [bacterium]